jgi:hypothetical protein
MEHPQNGIEDPTHGAPSGKDGARGFVSDRERVLSYPQAVSKDNSEARPGYTFCSLFPAPTARRRPKPTMCQREALHDASRSGAAAGWMGFCGVRETAA